MKQKSYNQACLRRQGIAPIIWIIIIALLGGVIIVQQVQQKDPNDRGLCTQEAKVCPDGTGVVRVGPSCEFAPCPSEEEDEEKFLPPPPPPSITVISPNGGEVWQNGQTYAVSWNVQNVPQNAWIFLVVIGNIQGSLGDVDIAFIPLSGNSYSWTIPTDTYCVGDLCYAEPLVGTNLKVKAWLYDATGISNPCIGFCQPGTVPQLVTSDESDGVFIIQ